MSSCNREYVNSLLRRAAAAERQLIPRRVSTERRHLTHKSHPGQGGGGGGGGRVVVVLVVDSVVGVSQSGTTVFRLGPSLGSTVCRNA